MNSIEYIKIGIVRYVKDYEYNFKVYTKRRWIGQQIFNFFSTEFIAYTQEYYKDAILSGKITINQKQVDLDYILKDNDVIEHKTVRREPPVFNIDFQTIYEDDNLLVINKPPSIPVHPCGQFHYNSVIQIIEQETKKKVYPVHRIDKLTSGVLILAKKLKNTYGVDEKQKCYLARVQGNFPYEEFVCDTPIYCVSAKKSEYDVYNKNNHNDFNPGFYFYLKDDQKTALTKFTKIWYDMWSDSSLLECRPITGRTHQIRVHLKYLGHPIINDICYGGPNIGNVILRDYCQKNYQKNCIYKKKINIDNEEKIIFCYKNDIQDCFQWILSDEHAMEIYLHSWKYQLGDLNFESQKPYWADKDFNFRAIQQLEM